jgi:hypothetical protein
MIGSDFDLDRDHLNELFVQAETVFSEYEALVKMGPQIDPVTASNKRLADTFTCQLCMHVVVCPTQCKQCDAIFCKSCIKKQGTEKCGICSKHNAFKPKFNRALTAVLNALEFSCECDALVSYEDWN